MKVTLSFIVSLLLVVIGVALVTVPGALVVAGGLLCALTVLYDRGGDAK